MRIALVVLAAAALTPALLRAQQECELIEDPNRTVQITNRGTPYETYFVTDAVFVCPGGRRVSARNATYLVPAGQITLEGNVHVDEPDRTLRSEYAQYFSETRQMHARTNVTLVDTRTGSIITSQLLDVYQESPQRPEGLVVATGGAPRAVLFQEREGGGRDSTIVDAQEIRIIGEHSFRATGQAVMRRDSLTARGNAIDYAQVRSRMDVAGNAIVETTQQELRGDSITAELDDQDQIRDVLARHGSSLTTEDLEVTAPAIRLLFENAGVNRMVAMHWPAARDAAPGERARVVSEEFRLESDSIDVLAPEQQLREAIAVGDARGERILPDSMRALLPEAPEDVLALISSDWMHGDTVRARFSPNPRAETDTAAAATIMDQLSAAGEQAQSMYAVRDEADPEARLSFNYVRARYIEVNFIDGAVSTVAASGDARGVYLQPGEVAGTIGGTGPVSAAPRGVRQ
jgi:lipopolysaccharide export system protein LptA